MSLPLLNRFLFTHHDTQMFFDDDRPHVEKFRNTATVFLLDRFPLRFTTTLTEVTFEGPALIHFEIFTDLGRVRLFKTLLPIDDFHLYTEDRWVCLSSGRYCIECDIYMLWFHFPHSTMSSRKFAEPSVPRWLVWIISCIAKGALEQDRTVWENKVYAG